MKPASLVDSIHSKAQELSHFQLNPSTLPCGAQNPFLTAGRSICSLTSLRIWELPEVNDGLDDQHPGEVKKALSNQLFRIHDTNIQRFGGSWYLGWSFPHSTELPKKAQSSSGVSMYPRGSRTWHMACRQVTHNERVFGVRLCWSRVALTDLFYSRQLRLTSGLTSTMTLQDKPSNLMLHPFKLSSDFSISYVPGCFLFPGKLLYSGLALLIFLFSELS